MGPESFKGRNRQLIRDNLVRGERLRDLTGSCFLGIGSNMTAERYNALVAILCYGDLFEARLIQRFADALGYCRGFWRARTAREQSYCE